MGHFMHTTILTLLAVLSVNARPSLLQSYDLPQAGGDNTLISNPTGGSGVLGTGSVQPCTGEQVHNAVGECVLPEISRNIFVYTAPNVITDVGPPPNIPKPEVHYNLVFVKTSDLAQQNAPIIVPPPQQKTLVYVLSKKQPQGGNNVIHAPYNPAASPEVFYVNYGQGDNPQLPGGVDLQTALSSAFSQGENLNGQLPAFGGNQNQGNNIVVSDQNQGNNFVGTGQNQGNNYVPNIINGPTISGGFVSPTVNDPINGGFIDGGVINGGIIDSGFGGGAPIGQTQVDSGFGQGGFPQQPGNNVVIQSPTVSLGGIIDQGFGGGIPVGQTQTDSGFGQGGFIQQPGNNVVLQTPSNQGYNYPSPGIPLSPTQSSGQSSLSSGPYNPSPPSPPPSRPGQLYGTPN